MRVFSLVLAIGALPWLTGCATAPTSTGADPTTAKPARARADADRMLSTLAKGMTVEQVRTAWGSPEKIEPMEAPTGHAEVWTYVFSHAGQTRQMQTGETTTVRPNPVTGINETVSQPVLAIEQVKVEQTVSLLFYEGKLAEWKQSRDVARIYN